MAKSKKYLIIVFSVNLLLGLIVFLPTVFLLDIAGSFDITGFPIVLIINLWPIIGLIILDIALLIFAIVRFRPLDAYTKIGLLVILITLLYLFFGSILIGLRPAARL